MKIIATYLGCLTFAALFVPVVYADLAYVQTSDAFGVGISNKPKLTTKFYSKGLKQRHEMSIMSTTSILLVECGSKNNTRIDPKYQIYSICSQQQSKNENTTPYTLPFKVIDLGTTLINGQKAQHRKVEIKTRMNENPVVINLEVWSSRTPMTLCRDRPSDYSKKLAADLKQLVDRKSVKFSGDLKSLGAIYDNVPLRQKISMNSMIFGTTNTTKISTKLLSKSLFEVPTGYRQVSNEQFEEIRNKESKN